MPDKKITALTDGGAPQAADEFVVARAGDNNKLDWASLQAEVVSSIDGTGGQLTGDVTLSEGDAIDLTQVGQDIQINNAGLWTIAKSGDAQLGGDVTLSEGANITLTEVGQDITIAASIGGTAQLAAVFIATSGNDLNDGLSPIRPKLTIASALTAAAALIGAGAPRVELRIMDGGTYTEDVALDNNMVLEGRACTIVGAITLDPGAEAHVDQHFAAANSTIMVDPLTNAGAASHYSARVMDGRGTGGALTGVINMRNRTSGRVLLAKVGQNFVGASGIGVQDAGVAAGFGHIHFNFQDLYLAGNSAIGIQANNANTNLIGYIDHILEIGSPTTTIGINLTNAGAIVKTTVSEIIADEVWNISAGSLHIVCPKLTGTQTGSGTVVIDGTAIHVSNTPAGNIVATDVQAAINELDTEKVSTVTFDDHSARHENGGADEISVAGLSGELADAQPVTVRKNTGADVGTRSRLNLIEGTNVTLTVADDAGSDEVDITIASSGSGLSPDDENLILHMQIFA